MCIFYYFCLISCLRQMGAWEAWESPEFLGWKWAWGCGKWSQEDNYQVSFLWSSWVSSAKTNSLGSGCQIQTGQWEEEALIQSWSVWQRRQCKESSNREEGRQAKNDPWEKNTYSYKFFFNLVPVTAKRGYISWSDQRSWGLDTCKVTEFSLILRLNKYSVPFSSIFITWDFTCNF